MVCVYTGVYSKIPSGEDLDESIAFPSSPCTTTLASWERVVSKEQGVERMVVLTSIRSMIWRNEHALSEELKSME